MDPKRSEITEEMIKFFQKRTKLHIEQVIFNMKTLKGYKDLSETDFLERAIIHDKSKYAAPEYEGYVWLSWWHKCRKEGVTFEYPPGIENQVKQACEHHLKNNRHHAEFHNHPNDMNDMDIIEMVCDFTAISQEFNKKSCFEWVTNNIKNWSFSKDKLTAIFSAIEELDLRLAKGSNENGC